jgi:hypothetical protein
MAMNIPLGQIAAILARPIYEVDVNYVVIRATGGRKRCDPSDGIHVAFALPQTKSLERKELLI